MQRAARAAVALPGRNGRVPHGRAPRRCHGHAGGLAVVEIRIVSRGVPGLPSSHAGLGVWVGIPAGVGAWRAERPARNAGASSGATPGGSGASSAPTAGTAAAGSLPSIAAPSASRCAVGPAGTGGPADPAAAAPIVAAPAAEPHGGGAVQSLAGAPGRDAGTTEGGGTSARVEPASRTERAAASTFTGAASRRAQSTKVGQPANEPDRQYAAWWARARGAAGLSAKHRWRWSGPGAR